MKVLEFTIPGVPVAKGRARSTRGGHHYTPAKTRAAEETLAARAMMFRPAEPMRGPLVLSVIFELPIPGSWPRWKRDAAARGDLKHITKPDTDNLLKLLKDALTGVMWVDDRQVYDEHGRKRYSTAPATHVRIVEMDQASRRS